MARAMGVENPTSGKDFIHALDALLESIDCADLKMSEAGITREEMKLYPQRVHEVLGGDITADPRLCPMKTIWKSMKSLFGKKGVWAWKKN